MSVDSPHNVPPIQRFGSATDQAYMEYRPLVNVDYLVQK